MVLLGENLDTTIDLFAIYKRALIELYLCILPLNTVGNQNNQDVIQNQPAASNCFE